MPYLVCPAIDSVLTHQWPRKKTPRFKTLRQDPPSGRGALRIPLYEYPLWDFEWTLGYIPGNAGGTNTVFQQLINFFIGVQGDGQFFLFQDPYDFQVTSQVIGTANGTQTQFTMYRSFLSGGGQDLIQNFISPPSIYINGVLQTTGYTIDQYGTLTFTTAPTTGNITWTGQFYNLCNFAKPSLDDLTEEMYQLWTVKTFKFSSILL